MARSCCTEFADDFQLEYKKINEAFSNWYKKLPLSDHLAHFTNRLFDALSKQEAQSILVSIISSPSSTATVVTALTKTEKQTKEVFDGFACVHPPTSLIENAESSPDFSAFKTSAISESFAKR